MRDGLIALLAGNLRAERRMIVPVLAFKSVYYVLSALRRCAAAAAACRRATAATRRIVPSRRTSKLTGRVAARYRGCGRFATHYVAGKLRHDPLTEALLTLGAADPFGDVVDVGCGRGQFSGLVLEAGLARSVVGLDANATLLAQAERALSGLPFRALRHDLAADPALPAADTVMVLDVLYQLPTEAQARLLAAAARAARRLVLIRTADPARGWRAWLNSGVGGGRAPRLATFGRRGERPAGGVDRRLPDRGGMVGRRGPVLEGNPVRQRPADGPPGAMAGCGSGHWRCPESLGKLRGTLRVYSCDVHRWIAQAAACGSARLARPGAGCAAASLQRGGRGDQSGSGFDHRRMGADPSAPHAPRLVRLNRWPAWRPRAIGRPCCHNFAPHGGGRERRGADIQQP